MKDLHKAVFYMIISSIVFSIMNALVKYLNDFSAFQLVFVRSLITSIFITAYLKYQKINLWGNKKLLLVARGLTGTISLLLFFLSLNYMQIGVAVTLRYLSPIFAAIFAVIWLKEKIKPFQWMLFLLAFLGVFIIKGFEGELSSKGLILILFSAIFLGLVFVSIAKIGKSDHPLVVINYFMLSGVVVGGAIAFQDWKNPSTEEWVLLSIFGIVGFVGQIFMTKAFQIASTNKVAPIKYLEVVFTAILGATFFFETYSNWSILGIALIIAALVLNVLYKTHDLKS